MIRKVPKGEKQDIFITQYVWTPPIGQEMILPLNYGRTFSINRETNTIAGLQKKLL